MSVERGMKTHQTYYGIIGVGKNASNEQIMERFKVYVEFLLVSKLLSSKILPFKLSKPSSRLRRNHCIPTKVVPLMNFES